MSDIIVLFFVASFGEWLGVTYRLGSGECASLGRALTPYEVFNSIANERLKHIPPEARERHDLNSENTIKQAYKIFVSEYQAGNYRDALEHLPYYDRAPDGYYKVKYDDFIKRILRGNSYSKMEFNSRDSLDKEGYTPLSSYLVTNCGEVRFLEFPNQPSLRTVKVWSR